jgi:hypothetical protein
VSDKKCKNANMEDEDETYASFWNKNEKIVLVPTHLEDYLQNYGQSIYGKLIM